MPPSLPMIQADRATSLVETMLRHAGAKMEPGLRKEKSSISVISSITGRCSIWSDTGNRDNYDSVHGSQVSLAIFLIGFLECYGQI
jgi:hypothetical protein